MNYARHAPSNLIVRDIEYIFYELILIVFECLTQGKYLLQKKLIFIERSMYLLILYLNEIALYPYNFMYSYFLDLLHKRMRNNINKLNFELI